MILIKGLQKSFGLHEVIKKADFAINKGEVVALTGPNGSGKSTILKCVMDEMKADKGQIIVEKGIVPGYLRQKDVVYNGKVRLYLFKELKRLSQLYDQLYSDKVDDKVFANTIDEFSALGGYEYESRLLKELSEFGFYESVMDHNMSALSLGQRKIMELISLMMAEPDIFILDEPTNHLDIGMRVFLEDYINKKVRNGKTFLVVSHDRTFLDRITTKTVYIKRGITEQITGGYTDMLEHLNERLLSSQKESANLQKKIRNLENLVAQKKNWADKAESKTLGRGKKIVGRFSSERGSSANAKKAAKTAKAKELQKDRLLKDLDDKKPFIEKPIKIKVKNYQVANRLFVDVSNCHFGYLENQPIFQNLSFQIKTKDKIALIGQNGCGKTTLFKMLLGTLTCDQGKVYRNPNIPYCYLSQNIAEFFTKEILIDNFNHLDLSHSEIHAALKAARLKEMTLTGKIVELSRGELMRAAFVYVILSRTEFIFMDEPTNHIDVETLEVLQKIIEEFPGGLFFISHDRRFVSQNADTIYLMEDKTLNLCTF